MFTYFPVRHQFVMFRTKHFSFVKAIPVGVAQLVYIIDYIIDYIIVYWLLIITWFSILITSWILLPVSITMFWFYMILSHRECDHILVDDIVKRKKRWKAQETHFSYFSLQTNFTLPPFLASIPYVGSSEN